MAFIFQFSPEAMTAAQYDECIARLSAVGAGAPAGRLYHASYGPPERLRVFDVWDSRESFEAFGATLMPILQQLGVDPGNPDVAEVHGIITG
ncbi:MAG TPA: hypothetical protein VJ276_05965 [Thermoanaerobaculia bacterium]|nr:hypothetical protein [Thermoanaerobaculia bacterium]